MRRLVRIFTLMPFVIFGQRHVPNPPTGFVIPADCEVPWAAIASSNLPIDDPKSGCQLDGSLHSFDTSKLGQAEREQSRAKNRFCGVPAAAPRDINIATLKALQNFIAKKTKVRFGSPKALKDTLSDRTVLTNLKLTDGRTFSEGEKVRIVGVILKARFSDTYDKKLYGIKRTGTKQGEEGEAVNCHLPADAQNDIHIALATHADADECSSVTAEMVPHLRPAQWTKLAHAGTIPDSLFNKIPVRVTGQLFFDAMHSPCKNGTGNPARQSLWELHPVYAIDVCSKKTVASCVISDDSLWTPLDKFELTH